MNKTLVTKLGGIVSNTSLLRIGEMRVDFKKSDNPSKHSQGLTLLVNKNCKAEIIGEGYFTDATLQQNLGKSISLNPLSENNLYVSNNSLSVSISDKYSLTKFSGVGSYDSSVFTADLSKKSFDISSLKFSTALTAISFFNTSVSGDIDALKNLTALTAINFQNTSVSGDIDALKNLTALTAINFQNTSVSGDIDALKNLTALTAINFQNTSVSGDIDALKNLTALTEVNILNTRGDISALANLSKLNNITLRTSSTNGNMAKLPANLYFIGLNNYKGTGFTWDTRPSSANIFGVEGSPLVLNVDTMLNDLANCQKPTITNDKVWYRKILISGTRTSASDVAVQTLQNKGYTVSVTPA